MIVCVICGGDRVNEINNEVTTFEITFLLSSMLIFRGNLKLNQLEDLLLHIRQLNNTLTAYCYKLFQEIILKMNDMKF